MLGGGGGGGGGVRPGCGSFGTSGFRVWGLGCVYLCSLYLHTEYEGITWVIL